jgi:hypothetical protein
MTTRRTFLRGAGAVTLGTPFLEALPARAAAGDGPEFVIFVVQLQGTVPKHWVPKGTEHDFALPKLLQPLAPFADRMNILHGVSNRAKDLTSKSLDGHVRAEPTLLTSQAHGSSVDLALGPSIDQVLASRLSQGVPFRSLDLAVGTYGDPINHLLSNVFHAGPNDPVTSQADPAAVFESLFAPGAGGGLESIRQRRMSVLDVVGDQFARLRSGLGQEDQARLDAHADKIRQLEQQFATPALPVGECRTPVLGLPPDFDIARDEPASVKAQIELLTMALSCGLTRVGTLTFPNQYFNTFPWLNVDGAPVIHPMYPDWHEQIHAGVVADGDPHTPFEELEAEPGTMVVMDWYAQQVAELLSALDAVDCGGKTLLDRTMVVWINDFGRGDWHSTYNLPIVLAGNTGTQLGRFIDLSDAPWWEDRVGVASTNQLYVSMLNAFGFDDKSFGHVGDWGQGPLSNF